MPKFCLECGFQLKPDARFCTGCGVAVNAAPIEAVLDVAQADKGESDSAWDEGYRPQRPKVVKIAVAVALVVALAVGGYFGWSAWSSRYSSDGTPITGVVSAGESPGLQREMYAIADANVRETPSSSGSKLVSKLMRGTKISGVMVMGSDNETPWFKLQDGSGFVWAVNLSYAEPPVLSRILNSEWYPQMNGIDIRAQPDANSAILDTANIGHKYVVAGLTQNNFAELKLDKGGVGYVPADMVNLAQGPAQFCETNLMQTQGYTFDQASAQCAEASVAPATRSDYPAASGDSLDAKMDAEAAANAAEAAAGAAEKSAGAAEKKM